MKFSLFTPTHNPKHLEELYRSIEMQTYKDWEWVVVPNNGAVIPALAYQSPRIKIVDCKFPTKSVGALKAFASSFTSGDILVEVDHDDLLMPDCLETLHKVFQDPEVGFVYSDPVYLKHFSDQNLPFDPAHGWTYKRVPILDGSLLSPNSFEPSAASFGLIWYAPDHVRAWRKSTYDEIGGHNPNLSVLDDHELLIRTYLNTKVVHIPRALYIYRHHENNTFSQPANNVFIQQGTVGLFHQYGFDLVSREADLRGLKKTRSWWSL